MVKSVLKSGRLALVLLLIAVAVVTPPEAKATYDTEYASCGSGYAEGNSYSGYHAFLYFGVAGSTWGDCYQSYFAGYAECFNGSWYTRSGAWQIGGQQWYSLCGTNVAASSSTHRGCQYGTSCSITFYTVAQEP